MKHTNVMIVIDSSELTEKLYKGFIKHKYSLKNGTDIKGRFDQGTQHIVVCNY